MYVPVILTEAWENVSLWMALQLKRNSTMESSLSTGSSAEKLKDGNDAEFMGDIKIPLQGFVINKKKKELGF